MSPPRGRCILLAYSDSYIEYWQKQGDPSHLEGVHLVFPAHKFDPRYDRCLRCGAAKSVSKPLTDT